jgi:hypothetical protein
MPENLSVEEWQIALRRQFGREQAFAFENIGAEAFFSEFIVANLDSKNRYRVAIRGVAPGENFCSCPDFATNDLGTCKHVEFTLAKLEKKRGGKVALKRGFQPAYSELYLHYGGARSVRFRFGSTCPAGLRKSGAALFDEAGGWCLAPERFGELAAFLKKAKKAGHDVRCYDDALAFVAELRDAGERSRVLDETYPRGADSRALRNLLKVPLYRYQLEGALFAARAGRCLIGDEMGLGKTIQAIAAAELMSRHVGVRRVLIVCPVSLKHQWRQEIARFAGHDAQVVHGARAEREAQYRDDAAFRIVNYEAMTRDLDLIEAWAPDLVIVDEAQRIKNWNTVAARALKRISSPYAIVLTGTPLENRLEELISIVQFVDHHRLGPTWRLLHEHQKRDETGRVTGYQGLDRIGKTLAPVMLRRRKAEVLSQLPARVDSTRFVPMTEQQMRYHAENGEIVKRIVSRWRKTGFISDADQRRLTCALQNMRMSCNSTYLLDQETDFGTKAGELVDLLEEMLATPGNKVVVFSQWVRTHEILIPRLQERKWGHVLFHGGVPSEKRPALVDRFLQDADCRVFLSTDAGGVGLNLQHAAATVINMDLPWNPAILEQRIGRVFRLGQSRGVQVVNLVAQGTIEEGMLQVLSFKKSLFAGVLDGGESEVFMNGSRLSKFMESVEQVAGAAGEAALSSKAEGGDAAPVPPADAGEANPSPQAQDGADLPAPADALTALMRAGLAFVNAVASSRGTSGVGPKNGLSHLIETDAHTGKPYLKLPLPEPAVLKRVADTLADLLSSLSR